MLAEPRVEIQCPRNALPLPYLRLGSGNSSVKIEFSPNFIAGLIKKSDNMAQVVDDGQCLGVAWAAARTTDDMLGSLGGRKTW